MTAVSINRKTNDNPHMNKDLLVLIDFSESSEVLVRYGISLAKQIGASIRLFHVASNNGIELTENQMGTIHSISSSDNEILRKLESYASMVRNEDLEVSYSYAYGNRKNEISDQIESTLPSLVIIGRSMKSNLSLNRLFGRKPISQSIAKEVDVPILLLGQKNIEASLAL